MPGTTNLHIRYRLADHVRACWVDDQVVLLDLRKNKYLGLGGPHLSALSHVIADWPVSAASSAIQHATPTGQLDGLLSRLDSQRMLVPVSRACSVRTPIEAALESLIPDGRSRSAGNWRHALELCCSSWGAAYLLRRRCLEDIATNVLCLRHGGEDRNADHARLQGAVSSYMRLRPFVLSAHDRCLHDSLCLIRFLAAQRLFPSWVIGVRTRPFGAHSWVQSGGLVLNDLHENVRAYTPILVV